MMCPVDQTTLQMSERHGIEIDYCPTCRGVWLDRGELDKIIDRAADGDDHRDDRPQQSWDRARDHDVRTHGKKRKKGFLSELFELD